MRWGTVDQLARTASIYRNAIRDGKSPVDAVAAGLGISYGAAKQRIWRARRAGHDMRPEKHPGAVVDKHG